MRKPSLFILSSVSAVALAASPAYSQTPVPADATPEATAENLQSTEVVNAEGEPESEGDIVVTGSRIRRDNYSTPQNVDILTRDDQILAGTRSTTDALQSATVTSGTSQISGSFLGFLSEGGQGANVVGLRGFGTARTLVLLNGRRLAPAGVGPQLVSADLNVLPTAAVQRIEVLREGASSIYGSDAIAGVINIITDTSIDGFTLDAYSDVPIEAEGGRTYRISATAGKKFERGHIMASFEFRHDDGLTQGARDDWRCPRELARVNGVEVGQGSPGDPDQLRCFPFERASIGTARGYGLGYVSYLLPDDYFGAAFGDPGTEPDLLRFLAGRFAAGPNFNDITDDPYEVTPYDLRPLTNERPLLRSTYLTPLETMTAYLNGSYELDALGNAELYGEALFSRRKTHQEGSAQLNFQQVPAAQRQLYGGSILDYDYYYSTRGFDPVTGELVTPGTFRSFTCAQVYGERCSPFFPTTWADAGINYGGPFIQPNRTFPQSQQVDFFRANVGLRGDLGISDWRYDVNAMVSRTWGESTSYNQLSQNFFNALNAVVAPAGTPEQYITRAIAGQVGAGGQYTCRTNVTNGAYNGGNCVVINPFDPAVFYDGNIPQGYFDYVYVNSTDRTRYNQETFNAVVDGSLPFNLPGGTPKVALGVEHRRDHIDDKPSPERLSGGLLGFGQAQRTVGSDSVTEFFGEVQLPLLADRPFFHLLELNASARYTNYESYGSDVTYAISGQWAPIRNIRFRANYSTNFRAPNLYEQFINDQVGFYSALLDPCGDFGTLYSPGTTVYENCLAELTPILDLPDTPENEALDFFGNGSIEVLTTGGSELQAEKAKSWGVGAVLTAPSSFADLSLAIDFWHVEVRDQVAVLGNLIMDFCYSADDYPDNLYCDLIDGRVTDRSDPAFGQIASFRNPYFNLSTQIARGLDFDARFQTEFLGGRFVLNAQATRMLRQQTEFLEGSGLTEYNGEIGYPNAGAGPKWVGSLDARFTTADDVTFRWGLDYVGEAADSSYNEILLTENGDICDPDVAGDCQVVDYDLVTEEYFEHSVSVRFRWEDVGQVTMGISNVFDEKPPTISLHPDSTGNQPRIGNYLAYGPYDYRGRSFFINVTRNF